MIPLIAFIIVLPLAGFYLWMFYEFANNSSLDPRDRQMWLIAFIFLNIFAAIYYFFTIYQQQ